MATDRIGQGMEAEVMSAAFAQAKKKSADKPAPPSMVDNADKKHKAIDNTPILAGSKDGYDNGLICPRQKIYHTPLPSL
jgi:hypothetical protein